MVVVEDEPDLRRMISMALRSEEIDLHEAGDGDEAWALICRLRPRLVVLDVSMPGARNGLSLTRAIKADAQLAGTRVILLTALNQDCDVKAGYEAGADLYLTKPFSPLELMTVVEEALED